MPIPLPKLDDRSYAELVEEAIAQIPVEYPEWTDRNPSDTGIILIELMAWLVEIVLYRIDRIPEKNYQSFLQLLEKPDVANPNDLQEAIRKVIGDLRKPYRAVTCQDYEQLLLEEWNQSEEAKTKVLRARCLSDRNLACNYNLETAPGHVSIVVVPSTVSQDDDPDPLASLWHFLDPRRLLTVRHHVVEAEYVPVQIDATLAVVQGAKAKEVETRAKTRLKGYFNLTTGGPEGNGWPFGRNVYISEVYALLDGISGVDYVEDVTLAIITNRPKTKSKEEIELKDYQLVDAENSVFNVTIA